MAEISPIMLTLIMFGGLIVLMIAGMPLTFTLGIISLAMLVLLWGTGGIDMLFYSVFGVTHSFALAAIPSFIFMGVVLQKSGIGEELFNMI